MNKQSLEQSDVREHAQFNKKSGEQLIEVNPIKGTPFTYIHDKETDNGFIALGKYKIADNFNNQEEAEAELPNVNNWDLLINIIIAIVEYTNTKIAE